MKLKKIISGLLAVVLVFTACFVSGITNAESTDIYPNKLLLGKILRDRKWVIDSLVDGDFTNNPYHQVCGGRETTFLNDVMTHYQDHIVFKVVIDAMEKYIHKENYVNAWTTETIADFIKFMNFTDATEMQNFVDKCVKSVDTLRYEDITNAILIGDYTSSWGSTLMEENEKLEKLRQRAAICNSLGDFQKALKNENDFLLDKKFDKFQDFADYIDDFMSAYDSCLNNILIDTLGMEGLPNDPAINKLMAFTSNTFVLMASMYSPFTVEMVKKGSKTEKQFKNSFLKYYTKFMDVAGIAFDVGSYSLEYTMILETMISQKDTVVAAMNRIAYNTNNQDLRSALKLYADLVEKQGNKLALRLEGLEDYISNKDIIGSAVLKGGGKLYEKWASTLSTDKTLFNSVSYSQIGKGLIKALICFEIAETLADFATNLEETTEKIYVCKYTDKLLREALKTYKTDYNFYLGNKSDEMAKRVLDDLELIKRIRLFGEQQGYQTVCSQNDSMIGFFLGGEYLRAHIDEFYQDSVDSLLGCSIYPSGNLEFTVEKGETLTVYPRALKDGSITMYGSIKKADGKTIVFPEADYILMSKIKLNGGTLDIFNNASIGNQRATMAVHIIEARYDSKIRLRGTDLFVGHFVNNGLFTLETRDDSSTFKVTEEFGNENIFQCDTLGQKIIVKRILNTGTVSLGPSSLDVYGDFENYGEIIGPVSLSSYNPEGEKNFFHHKFEDKGIQKVIGTGKCNILNLNNPSKEGVLIEGKVTVTDLLDTGNMNLRKGENITATGSCKFKNNYVNGAITLKDINISGATSIRGATHLKGNVSFDSDATFGNDLVLTEECVNFERKAPITVKSNLIDNAGTATGSTPIKLYGDYITNQSNQIINELYFEGKTPQTVKAQGDLKIGKLYNHNTSSGGIGFDTRVYVTDFLDLSRNCKIRNGKNLILTENTKLNGNFIDGDITVQNWTVPDNLQISGTFNSSGNLNILPDINLMLHKSNIIGAVNNNGNIIFDCDNRINAAVNGGTVKTDSDLFASQKLDLENLIFESKLPQEFANTAETNVKNLVLNNQSKGGFTAKSRINVSQSFKSNCKNIKNFENIVLSDGTKENLGDTQNGDMILNGPHTLNEGKTLNVNGKLLMNSGSALTLEKNSVLKIKRSAQLNGAKLTVKEGAKIIIGDYLMSSGSNYDIAGNMLIKNDALMSSDTVSASGLITFNCDLKINNGLWNSPNIAFVSKLPQTVSGSDITVGSLTVDNTSRKGFKANNKITQNGNGKSADKVA